jgi:spore coat polysaccharide biosynthesis predicted glycosyltransferase SpsG
MTRDPVLFRVDGTRAQGWDALARSLVLAAAMQRRRRPCHFVSRLEPATLAGQIRRGDNEWLPADGPVGSPEDLEQMARLIQKYQPAAVVVDAPHCGPEYLAELVALGPMVLCLDDAGQRFPCQLVVHPLLGRGVGDFDVCPGTQVLTGRRYALVRPGIRRVRLVRGQEPPPPFRLVINLGDDPHGFTLKFARHMLHIPALSRIDILGRVVHPDYPKWQALAEAHKGRVTVATETAEQAKRISRCHVAISEADTGALELACVGVPTLLVVQKEAYWRNAEVLNEEGAASLFGWHEAVSEKTLRLAVENLLEDQSERRLMARSGRALIDGRGPDRLITAMEVMIAPHVRPQARGEAA